MESILAHAFYYRKIDGGIKILDCRSLDHVAVIPEEIEGMPVLELGDYLFSDSRRETEYGVWSCGKEILEAQLPKLRGNRLTQLYLPASLKKIGKYAFYNCECLERLSCYSATLDWGAGAFTGCKGISFLDIHMLEGKKSCFQEIVSELKQTLYVAYHGRQEARLVFPEFYEEAVENTPARILETHMHGCGHQYRYCFQQSKFQFRDYDGLFLHVQVQEPEELVVKLAVGRLRYPFELTETYETMYMNYLSVHKTAAACAAVRAGDMEELGWLFGKLVYDRHELAAVIEAAGQSKHAPALSFLMDRQRGIEQPGRKRFLL